METIEQIKKSDKLRYENQFLNSKPNSYTNRVLKAILGHIYRVNHNDKIRKDKNERT